VEKSLPVCKAHAAGDSNNTYQQPMTNYKREFDIHPTHVYIHIMSLTNTMTNDIS